MNRGLTIVTKDTDFLRVREELHDLKLIMSIDALFLAPSVKLSNPYASKDKGIKMLESKFEIWALYKHGWETRSDPP
jgi:hypothetical protein